MRSANAMIHTKAQLTGGASREHSAVAALGIAYMSLQTRYGYATNVYQLSYAIEGTEIGVDPSKLFATYMDRVYYLKAPAPYQCAVVYTSTQSVDIAPEYQVLTDGC